MAIWDASVVLALRFENNKTDDTGTYTQIDRNTPLYSSTIKHDNNYSYYKDGNGATNVIELDTDVATLLSGKTQFTIECWGYHDSSKRYAFYFSKMTGVGAGSMWIYSDATTNEVYRRWNGHQTIHAGAITFNTWNHFAITFDNGTVKFYINNSLIHTATSQTNTFAADNNTFLIGAEVQFNLATFNYIDNFVISDVVRTSFPTLPLPDADTAKRIYTCRNINGGGEYKRIATKHNIAGGF